LPIPTKTPPSSPLVVGIGELLWDTFPEGRQIGGAPANFAYHCQLLGANAVIVSAVGIDGAGRDLLEALGDRGLNTAQVATDQAHPTGAVLVDLDLNGVPSYIIEENAAWDYLEPTSALFDVASQADAVCFGTLAQRSQHSRETILSFLQATRPDCLRIFDLNLRQTYYSKRVIADGLHWATVLKLNAEELKTIATLLGLEGSTIELLDTLATAYGLQAVALTMGEQGCILWSDGATIHQEGFDRGPVIDTVGAGDCFTAVLAMGLLKNEPPQVIAEKANWRAAYVCTQAGAMPLMP